MNSNWSYSPETLNSRQNRRFFGPCGLDILRTTLKNNRAPLLSNFKLCTWFHCHLWIQTGVTVRNHLNLGKICVDLCDLDLWPLTLTFCLDITSVIGKSEGFDSCDRPSNLTQNGFKSSIFQPVWPWKFMDDLEKLQGTSSRLHQALCIILNPSVNSNWSYCPEKLNSGQNRRFIVPCDLEIWRMTLKNN